MVGIADFFNQPQGGGEILGLLGNPLFTGGLGLLAGAIDDDVGFGQAVRLGLGGAQQAVSFQNQRLLNEANRQKLLNQARLQRARNEVFSRLGGQAIAPAGANVTALPGATVGSAAPGFGLLTEQEATQRRTPGLDPSDLGLFAQAFPEQAGEILASQITPQEPGDPLITLGDGQQVRFSEIPSDGQNLILAGLNPGSPEFNEKIEQSIANGGGTAADQVMAQAQATLAQLEVRREVRTEQNRDARVRNSLKSTSRGLVEISRINDRLKGTLGETGIGLDEARRVFKQSEAALKILTGFGDEKAQQVVNDMKRFETLALEQNIENIEQLRDALGGRPTEFEFDKFIQTGPSPSNPHRVNQQILLDEMRDIQNTARQEGVTLPQSFEDEIKRLEADLAGEGTVNVGEPEITPTAPVNLPKAARDEGVTAEQFQAMTPEERALFQ